MNLENLKVYHLGIDTARFGNICTFIDFGNVNYWFERDERGITGGALKGGDKLVVDIEKLAYFTRLFSDKNRFYFGLDTEMQKSIAIVAKARKFFDKTITKSIQKIRHYLTLKELG